MFGISNYKSIKRDELLKTIKEQMPDNLEFGAKFYSYSVVLELRSEEHVKIIKSAIDRLANIKNYTNNVNSGELAYGKITGHILVYGVHEKSREDFKQFATIKFEERLKKVEFENEKGRLVINLAFSVKDVNEVLDELIGKSDSELKGFGK